LGNTSDPAVKAVLFEINVLLFIGIV